MAEDHRRITFTQKEFITALDSYRRAFSDFLPAGEILGYKILPDNELNITVKMVHGKNVNEIALTYKLQEVLPVLLKFCSENNIQIVGDCKRCVKYDGDLLSLLTICEI